MLEHAAAWIAAWNRKDIDTLMEHFAADAVFVSPRARELTGSATVSGSAAIRSYWLAAMARAERFDFRLDRALWDEQVRELVVVYVSSRDGVRRRACEIMRFDRDGRQVYGEALYGAEL